MDAKVNILGPCEVWHGAAHLGVRRTAAGEVPVFVLLGPEGAGPETLARARATAGSAAECTVPGVHRLLDVTLSDDRLAWVFEAVEGVGLSHTIAGEGRALLTTRAAAEAVAAVAEILLAVDLKNRGPEPTDLFVDATGKLTASGFCGPFPTSPAMRAPRGDDGEAAAVYRLGVLLAHLLSGVAPPPASERSAHPALVRRALIRVMARPGPVLPERYGEWIRGMLAWEPAERPPLSTVPDGLRQVASMSAGASLVQWAAENVPALREAALGPNPIGRAVTVSMRPHDDPANIYRADTLRADTKAPLVEPPVRRRRSDADLATATPIGAPRREEDDPTQEATRAPQIDIPPPIPVRIGAGAGSMPVRVGPPPEAIREVRLPSGFLDADTDETASEPEPSAWLGPITILVYVTLVLLLLALVIVLGLYVFGPAATPGDDGPSLHQVLPPVPAD